MIMKACAEHHMVGSYCKILCKVREKCPCTLELCGAPFLHQVGKRKQEKMKEKEGQRQVPVLAPSWLLSQGTTRMMPVRQAVAPLRLRCQDLSPMLPEDSPAPDSGRLGLLGDVQYMCRWKSGKAEDFINVKQE